MKFARQLAIVLVVLPALAFAQEVKLEAIPPELAKALAPQLVEQANKGEPTKIKVEGDVEKANGFHVPQKLGALVVPQKDLKEGEELAAKFKTELGAPLAYLFVYNLVPAGEGDGSSKKIDANRLRAFTLATEDGKSHNVHLLTLVAKQLSAEDYRLHVYGTDPKPLIDARFAEGTGPGPEPVAIEVKDVNHATKEGKIVVTVFGKYQASFQAAYTGE